jgi:dipeptidyl-peptidase-4
LERLPGSDQTNKFTDFNGQESVVFSKDFDLAVVSQSNFEKMPIASIYRDGKKIGELPSVAEEPKFTPSVTFGQFGVNQPHQYAIIKPRHFDEKKKYPIIVDVYGGPHHLHVVNAKRNWLMPQFLADQGYVVIAIENRGTPGRGRDWEREIYQKFGEVPLDDQVKILQQLCAKHSYLDAEKVGITGWSFGGYMSALAVLKRPDIFKAAVAGAPVTDWEDYDSHYTERYLGLPDESPRAYVDASLIPLAKDLKRPLLLVHGTADDNVYFKHTLRLTDALFRHGKEFDVLPLPSLTHMLPDPVVTEKLWTKVVKYFDKHLK